MRGSDRVPRLSLDLRLLSHLRLPDAAVVAAPIAWPDSVSWRRRRGRQERLPGQGHCRRSRDGGDPASAAPRSSGVILALELDPRSHARQQGRDGADHGQRRRDQDGHDADQRGKGER